jgi:hypothetical protein
MDWQLVVQSLALLVTVYFAARAVRDTAAERRAAAKERAQEAEDRRVAQDAAYRADRERRFERVVDALLVVAELRSQDLDPKAIVHHAEKQAIAARRFQGALIATSTTLPACWSIVYKRGDPSDKEIDAALTELRSKIMANLPLPRGWVEDPQAPNVLIQVPPG